MHVFFTFSAKDITFLNNWSTKLKVKHRLSLISEKLCVLCTIGNKIDFKKLQWVKIYSGQKENIFRPIKLPLYSDITDIRNI